MHSLVQVYLVAVAMIVLGAIVLHVAHRIGGPGPTVAAWLCRAPGVDLVVLHFTVLPEVVGAIMAGWWGMLFGFAGQVTGALLWVAVHELLHPPARSGPRIHRTIDRIMGTTRNHVAVWWTGLAVPVFWLVRLAQVVVYPPLTWLVRLPRYRQSDWVNISRHKFEGLVGYDRIWCLYCDWMTGVWSLGSEMLRNVESFWCPIRFTNAAKCENCRVDFPDIDGGWVSSDGQIGDVTAVLEDKYGGPVNAWFGHPVRLTVEGAERDETSRGSSPA